jgi:D-alanyl-D-alanine carboxypeptidase (penicillin-binding protein 5/6)
MENRTIREVVRTESIDVTSVGPEQRVLTLVNYNGLLGQNGVHGVKTGSTEAAGGCLVIASWTHGRNRVITVILGSTLAYDENSLITVDARWDDMTSLLSALDRDYQWIAPAESAEVPGLREELAAWQVELREPASVVVPSGDVEGFRYRLKLGPPQEPKSQVGVVLFFVGSEQIAERPVFQIGAPATSPVTG